MRSSSSSSLSWSNFSLVVDWRRTSFAALALAFLCLCHQSLARSPLLSSPTASSVLPPLALLSFSVMAGGAKGERLLPRRCQPPATTTLSSLSSLSNCHISFLGQSFSLPKRGGPEESPPPRPTTTSSSAPGEISVAIKIGAANQIPLLLLSLLLTFLRQSH